MDDNTVIALVSFVALALYVWLICLFIRLCKKVDRISSDTITAAYYVNKAIGFGQASRQGQKCLSIALFYVKQGKIGDMPMIVLSGYQPGEDYAAYLEKYITEKLR